MRPEVYNGRVYWQLSAIFLTDVTRSVCTSLSAAVPVAGGVVAGGAVRVAQGFSIVPRISTFALTCSFRSLDDPPTS